MIILRKQFAKCNADPFKRGIKAAKRAVIKTPDPKIAKETKAAANDIAKKTGKGENGIGAKNGDSFQMYSYEKNTPKSSKVKKVNPPSLFDYPRKEPIGEKVKKGVRSPKVRTREERVSTDPKNWNNTIEETLTNGEKVKKQGPPFLSGIL